MKRRIALALIILLAAGAAGIAILRPRGESGSPAGPRLEFWGAARRVGGSCLIVDNGGRRFVVDCGSLEEQAAGTPPPGADSLSFAILTHAHIDHCGLVPELVAAGFRGRIYCSEPTAKLVPIMLGMERTISREKLPREAFDRALAALTPVPFGRTIVEEGAAFRFRRVEHLLGAASVEVWLPADGDTTKLAISGDIGAGNALLIPPRDMIEDADYVVIESTYGGVVRDSQVDSTDAREAFARTVGAVLRGGGDVLVAAFTLGRTQEVLAVVDRAQRAGIIPPDAEVFVDSPTARKVSEVYRDSRAELSSWARAFYPEEILRFPTLREVRSETSLKVHSRRHRPTIFVSSSGDLGNASSPRHLMKMFGDERNLLCITGWQPPGSLGARLLAGESPVLVRRQEGRRFKEDWISPVLAVRGFHAFSGHADQPSLLEWLGRIRGVKRVFVVHGEEGQAEALALAIRAELALPVEVPHRGDGFALPRAKGGER